MRKYSTGNHLWLLSIAGRRGKVQPGEEEECHAKIWMLVPRILRPLDHGSKKSYSIRKRNPKMYLNIQLVESPYVILEESFSGKLAPESLGCDIESAHLKHFRAISLPGKAV